jgi:hypothetical protein
MVKLFLHLSFVCDIHHPGNGDLYDYNQVNGTDFNQAGGY